jgi:hypothetical protein
MGNLADVAVGSYLRSGGVGANPVYSTTTIPNTSVLGDIWYGSAANVISALAGNTTTTKQFLTQTGTGAVSASPTWSTIAASDLPGSFSGFANPSGLIGLTAANGVATTATRSDATHALDQGISPTWTGTHTFNNSVTAASVNVTSSSAPANGTYLPVASTYGCSAGSTNVCRISTTASQLYGPTAAGLVDATPDTGTFTITYTGMTATITCTATWARMGKIVTVTLCPATGTSNATTLTATGIPAAIQPPALGSQFVLLPGSEVDDNSAQLSTTQVMVGVRAAVGTWDFYKAGLSTGWTAAGTKGFLSRLNVTYQLN